MTAPSNSSSNFLDPGIIFPDDSEQLKYVLRDAYYNTASAVNTREVSIYALIEIVTGGQYYIPSNPQKYRSVFRKCFYISSLAAGTAVLINHGIIGITQFTQIYGTAVGSPYFFPIPYSSISGSTYNIDLKCTATQIDLNVGTDCPSLTMINIVLEYLKN